MINRRLKKSKLPDQSADASDCPAKDERELGTPKQTKDPKGPPLGMFNSEPPLLRVWLPGHCIALRFHTRSPPHVVEREFTKAGSLYANPEILYS